MIIVITTAANTAMYPDDVTGLQDNVTEDVNRAGTTKLVSRVCHLLLLACVHMKGVCFSKL